jgi:peptide chain release factor subunit 1
MPKQLVNRTTQVLWESLDERESRIEQMRTARVGEGRGQEPEPRALDEASTGACLITRDELRQLIRVYDAPVVSLYLEIPAKYPKAPRIDLTVFHSMRRQVLEERRDFVESLDHDAKVTLRNDLAKIEDFLGEFLPKDYTSLVILTSGEQLNRVIPLPVRVRDRLAIDLDPLIEPLEVILEEQRRVLVLHVTREDARFWTHCLGREQEVGHLRGFVPDVTVDKSRPAKVQRHRLTHLHWHLRSVVQATSRLLDEQHCDAVVLAGERTVLSQLEELLPDRLRQRVAGRFHTTDRTRHEFEEEVEAILARQRADQEAEALGRLPELSARRLVVSGLRDVVGTMNRFLVRRLYVSDRLDCPGYVCREHHFLSLEGGRCVFCDRELLPVQSIVDELIEVGRLYGVETMVVERRIDLLDSYDGIAAVTYPTEGGADCGG